jgi:hypothetical protein
MVDQFPIYSLVKHLHLEHVGFGVHSALRLEPMRSVLLILCITFVGISGSLALGQQHETTSGRVIAYSGALTCLNGNGYWSMVIRVQHPKDAHSEFIRVDFSLPCKQSPEWVSTKPSIQKFHLVRQKNCDAVLSGSVDEETTKDLAMPIWKYAPGTEHETLPLGRVVPCYRSIDLPLAPVV